jgi:hypothetical protein
MFGRFKGLSSEAWQVITHCFRGSYAFAELKLLKKRIKLSSHSSNDARHRSPGANQTVS